MAQLNMIKEEDKELIRKDQFEEMLQNLPKMKGLMSTGDTLFLYKGFWIPEFLLKSVVSFQKHFVAHENDVVLASSLKTGTTWLMALAFSIVNRNRFAITNSPLLLSNPHDILPHLEVKYTESQSPNFEYIPKPRLLHTHVPYQLLPPSIKSSSNCKIVYICRNPMDVFVSLLHFIPKFKRKSVKQYNLEECSDMFCHGIHDHGPYFDHVLGFWKASLECSQTVFLIYEDLKEDSVSHIKRLAEFLGFPFYIEEEKQGVIKEILELCSFRNLKNLNTNMFGTLSLAGIPNSSFFRKGEVGDGMNNLTPSMIQRMEMLIEERFKESHLTFKLLVKIRKGTT